AGTSGRAVALAAHVSPEEAATLPLPGLFHRGVALGEASGEVAPAVHEQGEPVEVGLLCRLKERDEAEAETAPWAEGDVDPTLDEFAVLFTPERLAEPSYEPLPCSAPY